MSNWFRVYGFADVHDQLLVGAYPLDHDDVSMLAWMKIERILNLVEDAEYEPGEREELEDALDETGIEEHRLSLTDYGRLPAPELEQAVGEVIEWLEEGHRVYLHCRAGWQRSAAVAAGVVALIEGVEIEEALDLVRQRKPSADPLPQQREDLLKWWAERDPSPPRGEADDQAPGPSDEGGEDMTEAREETDDLLRWWADRDPGP
ncbi:MAG TPA: dual specificity protein phosphatase family protein, partial [Solirubrobacteraceae bacterium]